MYFLLKNETISNASAPQQKENTSLPAPAQRSKKLKKDVRKTAPAINNEPDIRNMAMMAGFSGLMDAIHPLSTLEPSSQLESLSSLLAESREELEGLETQSEKIRRLEAQLEVEKSKVLELQLKLIEKGMCLSTYHWYFFSASTPIIR